MAREQHSHTAVRRFGVSGVLLAVALVVLSYVRERHRLNSGVALRTPRPRATSAVDARTETSPTAVRRFHFCDVLLPLALALWMLSSRRVDPSAMDDWGLLRALPVTYFVALALLAVSSAWLLASKRLHPARLGLHLVALVLILHGTVPLIFPTPSYPWVYKHIGVIGYIAEHGSVDATIDIYHNWPGFFALAAWFGRLAGVDSAISYAAWAPVYFNLLICLQLSFVFRTLPVSRRTRWLALFCFVPFNWVGQDYFAPQAIAVVLSLGVFGMTLAWLRADRAIRLVALFRGLIARLLASRTDPPTVPLQPAPADLRPARLLAILGVFAFLVVSHQLTPFAVIIGLGLISAAGFVRPRWVVVAMAAIAAAYMMLHLPFLTETQDLFGSLFDLFGNLNGNGTSGVAEAGRRLTALAAPALMLGLWSLAGLGILRRLRAGRPVLMIALLAAAPGFIAVAQSYGGEAIFRLYLFALPWTVLLAACALRTRGRAHRRIRAVAVFGLLAGTTSLFMSAFYGSQELYRVHPGEVDASRYFYDHAQPGSVLVLAAPHFPGRVAADYASFVSGDSQPNLMERGAGFRGRVLGSNDVGRFTRFADAQATGSGSVFFAVTAGQKMYAQVLGLSPPGSLARLESAVAASPDWRLVCRNADATLFIRGSTRLAGDVGACRDATPPFHPPRPSTNDVAGLAVTMPLLVLALVRKRRRAQAPHEASVKVAVLLVAACLGVAGALVLTSTPETTSPPSSSKRLAQSHGSRTPSVTPGSPAASSPSSDQDHVRVRARTSAGEIQRQPVRPKHLDVEAGAGRFDSRTRDGADERDEERDDDEQSDDDDDEGTTDRESPRESCDVSDADFPFCD